jgi:GrpB-like predicted nucleotidyltransferase (UPF0157 family)
MSDKTDTPTTLSQEHDPRWAGQFRELRTILAAALQDRASAIHHIGSTSIPGMLAKPILDISVELAEGMELDDVTAALVPLGYSFQGDLGVPERYAYGRESEQVPRISPPQGVDEPSSVCVSARVAGAGPLPALSRFAGGVRRAAG